MREIGREKLERNQATTTNLLMPMAQRTEIGLYSILMQAHRAWHEGNLLYRQDTLKMRIEEHCALVVYNLQREKKIAHEYSLPFNTLQ